MEILILLTIAILIVASAVRFPGFTAIMISLLALSVSCSKADTLEVAAIIESEADRPAMEDAMRDAAAIYRDQLGIDVAVTAVDVGTVAGHTHVQFLLDAVKTYRLDRPQHRAADATVLFTRRDIRMGTSDYTGYATTGPVCSAAASAVIELRGDGNDGALLAHELAHTLGVPHDAAPGWLMSESPSRSGGRVFSPDSVLTVRAAGGECFTTPAANPPPAAVQPPAAPFSTGGGGSTGWELLFLVPLALWRRLQCKLGIVMWVT